MKMTSIIFLGSLLVVIGIVIILNVIFKTAIPVFRILIAFVFVFIGIKILFGKNFSWFRHASGSSVQSEFSDNSVNQQSREFNIVFGKNIVDLRDSVFITNSVSYVHVNVVFGHCEILLTKDSPYRITYNTAFSNVRQPNGNKVILGSIQDRSENFDESKPYLDLRVDAVFSEVIIVQY